MIAVIRDATEIALPSLAMILMIGKWFSKSLTSFVTVLSMHAR